MPHLVKSRNVSKYSRIAQRRFNVVEPLLDGIVLGLSFITLAGLFYKAYQQFKRGEQLGL